MCEKLVELCELRAFQAGDDVIKQGQRGTCMHIIIEGAVSVQAVLTNGVRDNAQGATLAQINFVHFVSAATASKAVGRSLPRRSGG